MTHRKLYLQTILLSSLSIASIYLVLGLIRSAQNIWLQLLIDFGRIFVFSISLWIFNLLLFYYVSKKINQRLTYLFVVIVTSIVAYYGMVFMADYLRILDEIRGVKPVGIGFRGVVANVLIVVFLYSTNIFSRYKEIEAENERLKNIQLENQLYQLKAQLNPHFLFNSLSTLKAMVEDKDENSVEYLINLSEVYRYFLDNLESHLASIQDELKIANAYFFMLKNRFDENIEISINFNEMTLEKKIPAMSLQLLIENAVKHNIISRKKPLKISIFEAKGYLFVVNNFQPKRSSEYSTKIGLKNLDDRCKILTNKKIEVETLETEFRVKVPLV